MTLLTVAALVILGVCANFGVTFDRFRLARYLWALPNTLVGLGVLAAGLAGGVVRLVDGVVEVHGPFVAFMLRRMIPMAGGAAAITFGHIVAARDAAAHEMTRAHERVHVRQCERWGPFFIPAYLLSSLWVWLRGGDAYEGNYFERQAWLIDEEPDCPAGQDAPPPAFVGPEPVQR